MALITVLAFIFYLSVISLHDRFNRSGSSSEEYETDVREVNVCNQEERRFGKLTFCFVLFVCSIIV